MPAPCFLGLFCLLGVVGALRDFTLGMIVFPSFMSKSRQANRFLRKKTGAVKKMFKGYPVHIHC